MSYLRFSWRRPTGAWAIGANLAFPRTPASSRASGARAKRCGLPIAQGDDVFTVLPATLEECDLARRLGEADAIVIMKLGRNLPKVRRALTQAGRLMHAIYVERATMAGAAVMALADKVDDAAPYFAVVLVPGFGQKP